MLTLSSVTQIESLFTDMEPTDLAGQPFTPALHSEDLLLDDAPPEYDEDERDSDALNDAKLGGFTYFVGSEVPAPLVAIDAGVLDLGLCRTGFALAFKAAVVAQDTTGIHTGAKIGPRVKFIVPDNRADLLHYVGRELMSEDLFVEIHPSGEKTIKAGAREPNQFKDRIRNFIERMLQMDIARQLQNGILIVDGALTLRTYNTPQLFLETLAREAARNNSDIVGVSKKSRITVGGVHVAALLDGELRIPGKASTDSGASRPVGRGAALVAER